MWLFDNQYNHWYPLIISGSLLCAIIGWLVGNSKRQGCLGCTLGCLLGPLGILIAALLGKSE